jgi:hypothetical protein
MTGLPKPDIQMETPINTIPPYASNLRFPSSYHEDIELPETPNVVNWLPPKWYRMSWYLQYQLGIFGTNLTLNDALPPGYHEAAHLPNRL